MKWLRDNGLTLVLMAAFVFSIFGMALAGWRSHNEDLAEHGAAPLALVAYLASGDFISAVFENWESEFLQMSAYVILTAYLFQRGSAESKDPDDKKEERQRGAPLPRNAGWSRLGGVLYSYSLGIALGVLFILSFLVHLLGSVEEGNARAVLHGAPPQTLPDRLADSTFWFESFQNWQSEFLSTAVLVVLSIFFRYRGSPESKPVPAAHSDTGA